MGLLGSYSGEVATGPGDDPPTQAIPDHAPVLQVPDPEGVVGEVGKGRMVLRAGGQGLAAETLAEELIFHMQGRHCQAPHAHTSQAMAA